MSDSLTNVNNFTCKTDGADLSLDFKRISFPDDKYEKKFIKSVKIMIRGSLEYKEWLDYLIHTKNLTQCLFTNEKLSECTIEFHHHPVSLENIVTAVVDKFMDEKTMFSTADVFLEIMKMHFSMKIGVVPMVTTLHQKFHNGFLSIPMDLVIGDYQWFMTHYPLRDQATETVNKYLTVKNTNHIGWNKDTYVLK